MYCFKSIKYRLKSLRERAKEKNIPFNLNSKWLKSKLTIGHCETTGIKFDLSKVPFVNPYYPSIDRVDSSKGYTTDNCKLVCLMYNTAKCEFSEEVFKEWAKAYVKEYELRN